MGDKSVLSNLFQSLGLTTKSGADRAAKARARKTDPIDTSFRDFEVRLNKTLSARQREIEGRVYLISFGKVRAHLGERWAVAAGRIHALIERVLDRRLAERDLYIRYREDSYLIVFAVLGPKEAQLKCTRIAEDVLKRLVGSETIAKFIDIQSVHPDDSGGIKTRRIASPEDLVEEVVQRIDSLPQSDAASEAPVEAPPPPAEPQPDTPPPAVDFIFRPLLTVRTKIVSTFLCFPVQARPNGGFASGYQILSDPTNPDQIFELDLMTLKRIAAELPRMVHRNARSLLGVPIHQSTLGNPKTRGIYVKWCNEFLTHREHQIVFEIVGMPLGIPHAHLLETVALLRPYSRAVIARIALGHGDLSGFKAAGMHAVGTDIYDLGGREKTIMNDMDAFVRKAKNLQLKTYVHGVRSISLYTSAVCSGFDYLAGYALTSISEVPQDAYAFSPDMPYLSLFADKTKR